MVQFHHDLVLLLGARAWVSLAGIVGIAVGTWKADRDWDEALLETKEKDAEYQSMEQTQPDWKLSYTTIGGWILLSLSYFLSRKAWFGWEVSPLVVVAVLLMLAVGFGQTVLVRQAMMDRTMHQQKEFLGVAMGFGILLGGVLTALIDPDAPVWAAPLGSLGVALSPLLLWKARYRGYSYDHDGTINETPIVWNFGGPLLVFGWFWFWMGLNATPGEPSTFFIPLFFSTRTLLAHIGAVLILVVYWSTNYAVDELDPAADAQDAVAFGMAGLFWGSRGEIRIGMVLAFVIFGLAPFFPFWTGLWPYFLLLACGGVAFGLTMLQEVGLRSGQVAVWKKWIQVTDVALLILVVFLGAQGGLAAALLAIAGGIGWGLGMHRLHRDRKRGHMWLTDGTVNVRPVVYSDGALWFPLGVLLLAWSMSVPPNV